MASAVPALVPPASLPACQQPNAQLTAQMVGVPSHSLLFWRGLVALEAFGLIKLLVKVSAAQGAAFSDCSVPTAEADAASRQHHCLWTHLQRWHTAKCAGV